MFGGAACHFLHQFVDERVWKAATRGDGIEGFADLGDAMGFDEEAGVDFVTHDDRGSEGEAVAFAREQAEHGHVVHLGDDPGPNPCG